MGDDMEQGTHEPGIVGNWYIDLKKILEHMAATLGDMPTSTEYEILASIECGLMADGHRLAVFLMQFGDLY